MDEVSVIPGEQWVIVEGFPTYAVSDHGRVIQRRGNIEMTRSPTEYNELTVGMMQDGIQHRRSIKVLVARAFVAGETRLFNTPILLDGDRENLHKDNILWRPRWFALMYARQFTDNHDWWYAGPVMNMHTEEVYDTMYDAALATGSLVSYIRSSVLGQSRNFPDGCIYRFC